MIHITQLTCHVIVTSGSPARSPATGAAAPVAQPARTPAAEGATSAGIDVKALTDRVYRLLQEELTRALERE